MYPVSHPWFVTFNLEYFNFQDFFHFNSSILIIYGKENTTVMYFDKFNIFSNSQCFIYIFSECQKLLNINEYSVISTEWYNLGA